MPRPPLSTSRIAPKGDQAGWRLERIVLSARVAGARDNKSVRVNGEPIDSLHRDQVIISKPSRGRKTRVQVEVEDY